MWREDMDIEDETESRKTLDEQKKKTAEGVSKCRQIGREKMA